MFVIIGLGNPGKKYQNSRHNIGHIFIDYFKSYLPAWRADFKTKYLNIKPFKTDCFMNFSGNFVKKIINSYQLLTTNLIIVHDDLDIPLGKFKIQKGIGPKLHNGVESIEKILKTKDFWRIRIGVDNRSLDNRIDGETYILNDFSTNETEILKNQVFPKILEHLKHLLFK